LKAKYQANLLNFGIYFKFLLSKDLTGRHYRAFNAEIMKSADPAQWAHSILIFTDGACSGNPGPGGWGSVIAYPGGKVKELGGGNPVTTNNQMEMTAALKALEEIKSLPGPIYLYTDSTYVIRGITQWIWGWRKRGWKTAEGADVVNKNLWQALFSVLMDRNAKFKDEEAKINWLYSRGHIGTPGNERCDEIAVAYSKKQWVELYSGNLLQYPIAIYDVPENSELPEMRPKQEKKVAYSYLSLVHGEVYRHRDWGSCERRVKGQSGAKFKKAMAAAEEISILNEWGVSPAAVKE
jgi:ribonuclease HI